MNMMMGQTQEEQKTCREWRTSGMNSKEMKEIKLKSRESEDQEHQKKMCEGRLYKESKKEEEEAGATSGGGR